jgi:hypothetical protein
MNGRLPRCAWIGPGLVLEHPDLDELIEALADLGPDLIAANTAFDPTALRFKLVAERLVATTL